MVSICRSFTLAQFIERLSLTGFSFALEEESKGGIEMRSCKHTEADEEFAMVR